MSKLVIEIDLKEPLKQNDVIRYNETLKKFEVVSYDTFNQNVYKKINLINEDIKAAKDHFSDIIDELKKELKLHKDALKILTGRDL